LSPSVAVAETAAELGDTDVGSLPPLGYAVEVTALDGPLRGTGTTDPERVSARIDTGGTSWIASSGRLEAER